MNFYKIYIGKAVKKGMPKNAKPYGIVLSETLIPRVNLLVKDLKKDEDLYVVNGHIYAYKRDSLFNFFC